MTTLPTDSVTTGFDATHAGPAATPRSRVIAAGMLLGPLLLLASSLSTADSVAGVLQIWSMAGMMLALVGVTQVCARWRPRLAALLTGLGAVGIAGGAAYGLNVLYIGSGAEDLNKGSGAAVTFALHLPGPLLPLTFLMTGVLLLRCRVRPTWSGWALIAGGILFPVSRIGDVQPLMPVPDALFLVGLAPFALALWHGREPSRG